MTGMGSSGRWLRGALLGRGSTGTVSLATSLETSATFAVKSAEVAESAALQREASLLGSIDSPHLISYLGFDVTREGGREVFNLFLEYAPGGSLADHIRRRKGEGGLEEEEIRLFARSILLGLSCLHSHGVAHCDVKGSNVLLSADGTAKLADLGCARRIHSENDQRITGGTPLFMSPEVARGEEQGTAADVWAVGCTVIEMATGRPPWPDVHDAVSAIHRIGFSGESPEIPLWLSAEARDFLKKCFGSNAVDRPTADELLHHPFVDSAVSPNSIWRSPKCVLDQDFWNSMEEEERNTPSSTSSAPSERIRQLAARGSSPSSSSSGGDPVWDSGNWITIRLAGSSPPANSPPEDRG